MVVVFFLGTRIYLGGLFFIIFLSFLQVDFVHLFVVVIIFILAL